MTKLRVVAGSKGSKHRPKPSRPIGKPGMKLWDSIQEEFEIADAAGIELLTLACQQLDRAEAMREQIDAQGEFILTKSGVLKEHPGLKHELHARQFVSKALHNLGLDVEPIKAIGRPNRPTSLTHEDMERLKLEGR